MNTLSDDPVGRFAPSPSGPLHFGSLVTAVASYCDSKSRNGKWLLRIEDLDTPRVVKGATDNILKTLEAFGFEWDEGILYQSQRFEIYQQAIQELIAQGLVYACHCSKKSLLKHGTNTGPLGQIYPGICQQKNYPLNSSRLRLKTTISDSIKFTDRHFGTYSMNLKHQVGDILIKRIDGIYAYHLAVVIDDSFQQINEIVRGSDLLEVSCVHLYLNQLLGLPDASYLHLPLAKNNDGQKLSKQTGAIGLDIKKASQQIHAALTFLGQDTPQELMHYSVDELLIYAIQNWDSSCIPAISK